MSEDQTPPGNWNIEHLTAETLPLLGGALCLDYTNTVDWRGTEWRHDRLKSYDDVLAWGLHAGALDLTTARRLRKAAGTHPKQARTAVQQARRLREAIYGVGDALARGRKAPATALTGLNDALRPLLGRTLLSPDLAPAWAGPAEALERALWPIAWSAFELFTGDRLERLRECANADCRWLFLDQSRNRSRRWCAMGDCGNLEKARRYRQRHG